MNVRADIALKAPAPIGYFVHHQGRGHAERCAALVNALPAARPVTIFCARDDIFPPLRAGVGIVKIPSLFEPTGQEGADDRTGPPDSLHCAPLGWPGIRAAMATMTRWFQEADPALMICDVSAEVAQLARICSVPHVKILQHGDRGDVGHQMAYQGAVGLLVPCDEALAQDDWTREMRSKAFFAGGLGIPLRLPDRQAAKKRLGLDPEREVIVVISGGGGSGFASAPLGVGARALPDAQWITVGRVDRDWHATEPSNLRHDGWVGNIGDYLAAADVVVASTGNTTCHQILMAGKPWVAVPEWRYFDEQILKAEVLSREGLAHHCPSMPASVPAWRRAISAARATHDPARQRAMVRPDAAKRAAEWIETLVARIWPGGTAPLTAAPAHADATAPAHQPTSCPAGGSAHE